MGPTPRPCSTFHLSSRASATSLACIHSIHSMKREKPWKRRVKRLLSTYLATELQLYQERQAKLAGHCTSRLYSHSPITSTCHLIPSKIMPNFYFATQTLTESRDQFFTCSRTPILSGDDPSFTQTGPWRLPPVPRFDSFVLKHKVTRNRLDDIITLLRYRCSVTECDC